MSSTSSPPEPTLEQRLHMTDSYSKFKHYAAVGMVVTAPVLVALPPRKLDLYTFLLGGMFVASANQLTKERTGAGLLYLMPGTQLPARAREIQEQQRRREDEKNQRNLLEENVPSEVLRRPAEHRQTAGLEKAAKDLWMGGETEGWKERRLKEEQEKLEQGEGYGSMIVDQIWDVWNWGEKKAEVLKKKDEEVVKEKKASSTGTK